MYDALILAKNDGYDVFNALDIMENEKFLKVNYDFELRNLCSVPEMVN